MLVKNYKGQTPAKEFFERARESYMEVDTPSACACLATISGNDSLNQLDVDFLQNKYYSFPESWGEHHLTKTYDGVEYAIGLLSKMHDIESETLSA
jgi:hypothetical protein